MNKEKKKREPNARSLEHLERIKTLIENRRKTFLSAHLSSVFIRYDDSGPSLKYCRIDFNDRPNSSTKEVSVDYGPLKILRIGLDVDEVAVVLENIIMNGFFQVREESPIYIEANLGQEQFIHSDNPFNAINWPLTKFTGTLFYDRRNIPNELPIRVELPFFPTVDSALSHYLELEGEVLGRVDGLEVIIPDYRARIKALHLSGTRIIHEIETGVVDEESLMLKLYVTGKRKSQSVNDLKVKDGFAACEIDFEPECVNSILMSVKDGDIIDRKLYSSFSLFSKEVIIDDEEAHLKQIIQNGENFKVEFKRTLDATKKEEYLESVVAFANSQGGTIIIGVDDHCQVRGWSGESEERIRNMINARCDPPVTVEIKTEILVDNKPVTVIEVPEGNNKPYFLAGKTAYVRKGSCDFPITRAEIDEILKTRGGPRLGFPLGWLKGF